MGPTQLTSREGELQMPATQKPAGELFHSVAPEIRSRLNTIMGTAELISDTPLGPEQMGYLSSLRHAGEELAAIVNDLSELSAIESGRCQAAAVQLELDALIESVRRSVSGQAGSKGLELSCEIAEDVPLFLIGDRERLRRVLARLLGDVVRVRSHGKISLTVQREPGADAGVLRFTIDPAGPEAPQEDPRVFLDCAAGGSLTLPAGADDPDPRLGLRMCRQVVALMGGRLWADAGPSNGGRWQFTVRLGIAFQHSDAAPPSIAGVRVVVADVVPANGTIVRDMLIQLGALVTEVGSAAAVAHELQRARAAGARYELLVLDADLPGGGFRGVVEELQREKALPEVAVVVLGCDEPLESRQWLLAAGIEGYLIRPVGRLELGEAMARELGRLRQKAPVPKPETPTLAVRRSCRLLVLENTHHQVKMIGNYLRETTHDAVFAGDVATARELFLQQQFNLLCVDISVLEHHAFVRNMRQWEAENGRKRTPIVAIAMRAGGAEWSRRLGCDAYLTKPVRKSLFLDAVERYGCGEVDPQPVDTDVPEVIRSLMPRYLEIQQAGLANLKEALRMAESEPICDYGQQLSGTAADFGFDLLVTLGKRLETASKYGNWRMVRRHLDAIGAYLDAVESTSSICA